VPGAAWNVIAGENMVGEKTGVLQQAGQLSSPLAVRDVYDTMRAKGFSKKLALSLLVILGAGAQNYQDATPSQFAEKIALHPKLKGFSKTTKKKFDYTTEVDQVIAEAKRRGLKTEDLVPALVASMKEDKKSPATRGKAVARLRARFKDN
jgi:hypothetical protein